MRNWWKTKQPSQSSETLRLGLMLAFSGGFQDAYTYNVRNEVFANAQTGNIVLLSQHLFTGQWGIALSYLLPVLTFACGVFLAENLRRYFLSHTRIHWRQSVLLLEILMLFIVGFLPHRMDSVASMLVSFACALQVQSFRKIHGYGYASTMCIGNLRSGTEQLSGYMNTGSPEKLLAAFRYYAIICCFAIGAGVGALSSFSLGIPAIMICCPMLFFAYLFMKKELR